MRTGTLSWLTRTPTCRSLVAESLSQRPCITLCDSTAETECTPDIYPVILLRTAVSECQSNTPLRFLMRCRSELPSLCSAGRQSIATTQGNRNGGFQRRPPFGPFMGLGFPPPPPPMWWRRLSCRVSCLSAGDSAFQIRWGQRTLQRSRPRSFSSLSGYWCWRWRFWARS